MRAAKHALRLSHSCVPSVRILAIRLLFLPSSYSKLQRVSVTATKRPLLLTYSLIEKSLSSTPTSSITCPEDSFFSPAYRLFVFQLP